VPLFTSSERPEHLAQVERRQIESTVAVAFHSRQPHLPDELLAWPQAWVMETHTKPLFRRFTALFARLGYTVTVTEEFPNNPPSRYVKVFQAVRT